jgi:hypothetical protein
VEIRTAPNTSGNRNGMPESGGYIYRGWGEDIMPWAITDDRSTDYDTGIEPQRARRTVADNRCAVCDNDYRSRKHRANCR